jgi:hypothetical protein
MMAPLHALKRDFNSISHIYIYSNLSSSVVIKTLEIPWLDPVEINLPDDVEVDLLGCHLPGEVVADELLLRGMEPEPWRHAWSLLLRIHCCSIFDLLPDFFCSTPSKETAALVSTMRRRGQRTRETLLEIGSSTVNKV